VQADTSQPTPIASPAADDRQPSRANRTADAAAGGAATVTASAAARASASFMVEVRSAPPGARVMVAGKRVGVTPTTIALDAPASITVSRAGYRSQRVRAERSGPIDVRLVPARPAPGRRPTAAGETLD
jgi:PEGA domain-containing protein